MRVFLKTLLSLSLSGSLLILLLLPLRRMLRGRLSQRCQHLLWLAVALRLLLPFSPESSLMSRLFRYVESPDSFRQAEVIPEPPVSAPSDQNLALALPHSLTFPGYFYLYAQGDQALAVPNLPGVSLPVEQPDPEAQTKPQTPAAPAEPEEAQALFSLSDRTVELLALVWLMGFLLSAGLRLWAYQHFRRQIGAQLSPPTAPALELADRLRRQLGLQYPVPLWVSPDLASPLLMRLDRPCVLLPAQPVELAKLRPALLHELAHFKRHDLISKALFQLVQCLHWFNPLVYLMVRLAQQDCELACDETALARLSPSQRIAYGDALLDFSSLAASPTGAVSLSADARLLKQRLNAILQFRQRGKRSLLRSTALLAALGCAALYTGAYAGPVPQPQPEDQAKKPVLSVQTKRNGATLTAPTIFYENNFLFVLSPCPDPAERPEARKRASYVLAFAPDCLDWRYHAALINGVDTALAGSSVQAVTLESVFGPYTESPDQLARKFYQANSPEHFGPTVAKAPYAAKEQLARQAYQEKKLEFFSLAVLTLDKSTCRQLALQALEDREASYLYPLAPLLEEEFCFDLADRAAQQGCYGCFIPLFEQLGEQNKLLMGRQAMENRDVLRFSMMRGRLSDSQRLQLAQIAYDADDLEFFNLSISRLSRQQRQDLMLKAYVEGRWQFYTALNNS